MQMDPEQAFYHYYGVHVSEAYNSNNRTHEL